MKGNDPYLGLVLKAWFEMLSPITTVVRSLSVDVSGPKAQELFHCILAIADHSAILRTAWTHTASLLNN